MYNERVIIGIEGMIDYVIIDEYGVCVLEEWLKRDGMMVVW